MSERLELGRINCALQFSGLFFLRQFKIHIAFAGAQTSMGHAHVGSKSTMTRSYNAC